jgi:hypothetical protein
MHTSWGGRAVTELRAHFARRLPLPCGRCGELVHPDPPGVRRSGWVIGHVQDRATHPELTWSLSNMAVEHADCSHRTGQQAVIAKAKAEGRAEAGRFGDTRPTGPRRRRDGPPGGSSGLVVPDPGVVARQGRFSGPGGVPGFAAAARVCASDNTGVGVSWDAATAAPWLADLAAVPAEASPPRAVSPPHPDAVGSYGADAERWVAADLGMGLRWWQRLALRRILEHDRHGELCWRTVLSSTPRRAGKSRLMLALAGWRLTHAELLGEVQTVVHTALDRASVMEVQRLGWPWAARNGYVTHRANGSESIELPDGSRWLMKSSLGVYGLEVGLGIVDEAWAVASETVDDGLEPGLLHRRSPQLVLTSTAHRRATSLMRRRLDTALTRLGEDWSTLVMWWSAGDDAPLGDPATWKAASPFWSDQQHRLLADRWERVVRGEADPRADDLDPVEGFAAQYTNRWPVEQGPTLPGDPLFTPGEWAGLNGATVPSWPPAVTAVEAWFGDGATVASAWLDGGSIVLSAASYPDVATAGPAAVAAGAPRLLVGKSIAADPVFAAVAATPVGGTTGRAITDLRRFVSEQVFRHDGSGELTDQVLAVTATPGADGLRLRSHGRCDALKAAAWAVAEARTGPAVPRIF